MIELRFEGLASHQSMQLGPAPWFRVAGNRIREGPHGAIVAEMRNHQWNVRGHYFTRVDCVGRAAAHFEDSLGAPTDDFGPFGKLFLVDGAIYGDDRLLGRFADETQLWHCFPTETFWPVVVFKAPEAPRSA